MGENSEIAWCDHTFNPVKGCSKVSAGCAHCYAERDSKRWGLTLWGSGARRQRTTPDYWRKPLAWNRRALAAGRRERVFCASWADVGEDHPDWIEARRDLVRLINATPGLDWLLLTKRPQNLAALFRKAGWEGDWPGHVWAGCTVEHQAAAEERIPHLLNIPARVRFLSCEPLLEPLNLAYASFNGADSWGTMPGISWIIVGGESGPSARLFDLGWARSLRDQCKAAGVPFFFKQTGAMAFDGPPELSVRYCTDHRAGADLAEFPRDLQIREFPA